MTLADGGSKYIKRQKDCLSNLPGATSPPDRDRLRLIASAKANLTGALLHVAALRLTERR
jgi:hypothetical protein